MRIILRGSILDSSRLYIVSRLDGALGLGAFFEIEEVGPGYLMGCIDSHRPLTDECLDFLRGRLGPEVTLSLHPEE